MENPFTIVEYVWLGGSNELRSKTKVIHKHINSLSDTEIWNADGSSTGQADGASSEVFIVPRRLFKCPFRRPNGLLVMCDTFAANGEPIFNNHRVSAAKIFEKYANQKPWYGLEQEYFIYDTKTNLPVGFDANGKQGQFYCGVGGQNVFCRNMVEEHLEACLYAGLTISGINIEVAPSQYEFQVGPVEGIDAADQLWMARYILERVSEKYGCYIVYHPKPLKGDWNGSGCHCNFSTEAMRVAGGLDVIMAAMSKMEAKHLEHMAIYGEHNRERMSGHHETSSYEKFSYGIASRKASIRIPSETAKNGYGYLEDRRPSSNCDPYLVTAKILETIAE